MGVGGGGGGSRDWINLKSNEDNHDNVSVLNNHHWHRLVNHHQHDQIISHYRYLIDHHLVIVIELRPMCGPFLRKTHTFCHTLTLRCDRLHIAPLPSRNCFVINSTLFHTWPVPIVPDHNYVYLFFSSKLFGGYNWLRNETNFCVQTIRKHIDIPHTNWNSSERPNICSIMTISL